MSLLFSKVSVPPSYEITDLEVFVVKWMRPEVRLSFETYIQEICNLFKGTVSYDIQKVIAYYISDIRIDRCPDDFSVKNRFGVIPSFVEFMHYWRSNPLQQKYNPLIVTSKNLETNIAINLLLDEFTPDLLPIKPKHLNVFEALTNENLSNMKARRNGKMTACLVMDDLKRSDDIIISDIVGLVIPEDIIDSIETIKFKAYRKTITVDLSQNSALFCNIVTSSHAEIIELMTGKSKIAIQIATHKFYPFIELAAIPENMNRQKIDIQFVKNLAVSSEELINRIKIIKLQHIGISPHEKFQVHFTNYYLR